jgi:hypothetical protein
MTGQLVPFPGSFRAHSIQYVHSPLDDQTARAPAAVRAYRGPVLTIIGGSAFVWFCAGIGFVDLIAHAWKIVRGML